MTKNLLALLLMGSLATAANGQTISVLPTQLNFGTVNELVPDSMVLMVSNPAPVPVTVFADYFTTYGQPAFSSVPSFTVPANGSIQFKVAFAPKHNILHNSELVLRTDSKRGSVSVDLLGQGHYSRAYYNNTENLSEQALKQSLKSIISANYNSLGYNTGRDRMFMNIDNKKVNGQGAPVNTLECVYTARVITGYTDRQDAQGQNFNTEHTFPQGFFNSAEPMKSDLHHLFPTDNNANNSRGNQPFGYATQPYQAVAINNPLGLTDFSALGANNKYEPRDFHKGAAARAMMYFVIRYQDYANFFAPQQAVLKEWNRTFQPTAIHVKRNTDVQTYQGNRNPFVDYPELADRITSFTSTSNAPSIFNLYAADSIIDFGLLTAAVPATYQLVLVNDGNEVLNLSNLALSDPAFAFATGSGANATVQPGEALTIGITTTLAANSSASGLLTFTTNQPGSTTVSIPLQASTVLAANEDLLENVLTVAPNPASHSLQVRFHSAIHEPLQLVMYNNLGQEVMRKSDLTDGASIQIEALPTGVYSAKFIGNRVAQTIRFVKAK
jgi:deoxyribonuclease-1